MIEGAVFWCVCGSNVFRKVGTRGHVCNACSTVYESDPEEKKCN